MKQTTWRLVAGLICALAALPAAAQDRIPSRCMALADAGAERVWQAQDVAPDQVRLRFINHATYLIEAAGVTAATDYTGFLGATDIVPDVATMNNAHGTHWTDRPDTRIPNLLKGWADANGPAAYDLDVGPMRVRNVTTDVRSGSGGGTRPDGNSIFIFEVAGLCVGHLGHLQHMPTEAQFAAIGRLDVVMVPVDGSYTMDVAVMAEVVKRLRSSVVLPMHWFSGASLDLFLAQMADAFDVVRLEEPDLTLSLDTLPSRPTIMVLPPAWLD